MKRCWNADELLEHWTLTSGELALLHNKTEHNRLGFALLLKFFQIEGRFPQYRQEVPDTAVTHVAKQVNVAPELVLHYDWRGRSIEYHRAQIRDALGFRTATVQDAQELTEWLVAHEEVAYASLDPLKAVVYQRCRALRIEPPAPDRVERIVRSAAHTAQENLCHVLFQKIPRAALQEMDALLETSEIKAETGMADTVRSADSDPVPLSVPEAPEAERLAFHELKADPGRTSLDGILTEIAKLRAIRQIGLPTDLFQGISPKLVARFRQRAAAEPPRELRAHPAPIRYTLLAALCFLRRQEITDNLVELLIQVIHKIGVRAEQKVEEELLSDFQRVGGKHHLLFQIAEVSLANPDGRVRDVVYPVVGEQKLKDLVREHKASGHPFRKQVYTVMRALYQNYYRRMVPLLLEALDFRSNNALHRPVIRAIELLKKYAGSQQRYYAAHTEAPIEGVVRPSWRDLLVEQDPKGNERVQRINYEICVLMALREKLRCKEIWVVGADRYRNPDDDLPADFAERRDAYYAALHQPREAEVFLSQLRQQMTQALGQLNREMPRNQHVQLLKKGNGWIRLSPLEAQPEPVNLEQLKGEVGQRWPMTSLLDILKEADLRVGFTDLFTTVASRERLDRATIQKRLLLCL
jgi:hypothetical protein